MMEPLVLWSKGTVGSWRTCFPFSRTSILSKFPQRPRNPRLGAFACHAGNPVGALESRKPPELERRQSIRTQDEPAGEDEPLEIVSFLEGKGILITGATGFVGKVLVEKILRVQPRVKQLYLVISPRKDATPEQRLQSEIVNSELFRLVRGKHGSNYAKFMREKITVVSGNVISPDLDLHPQQAEMMASSVDLVLNCAANTRFDERYDAALKTNTLGPFHLMNYAKTCPNIKLFVHVSTAFVCGYSKGIVLEEALSYTSGDNGVASKRVDVGAELQLTEEAAKVYEQAVASPELEMIQLGEQRARMFGKPNVYTFSKALGEMLLYENKEEIPIAVVRPSIVCSTYKEPFPGWSQGFKTIDTLFVTYSKGYFPASGFTGTRDCVIDLIPVDVVVNTILATSARHFGRQQNKDFVYHSTGGEHTVTFGQLLESFYEHYTRYPNIDSRGNAVKLEKIKLMSASEFEQSLWRTFKLQTLEEGEKGSDSNVKKTARLYKVQNERLKYLQYLSDLYHPYITTGINGRLDNTHSASLLKQVSYEEQSTFGYGVSGIDWDDYLVETQFPGVRRYVLGGRAAEGLN